MTENLVPIPGWDSRGLLPPYIDSPVNGKGRSPYRVGLTEFVLRFGASQHRRALLSGFLDFRLSLHGIGLNDGFQWVDGSFLEDTENHARREPNDIDVVTFVMEPGEHIRTMIEESPPETLDPLAIKEAFSVDAYFVEMLPDQPLLLVRNAAYWSSLWAHDRSHQWKGFVEIDLADEEDVAARAALNNMEYEGVAE